MFFFTVQTGGAVTEVRSKEALDIRHILRACYTPRYYIPVSPTFPARHKGVGAKKEVVSPHSPALPSSNQSPLESYTVQKQA
jgi:hypothetical protein